MSGLFYFSRDNPISEGPDITPEGGVGVIPDFPDPPRPYGRDTRYRVGGWCWPSRRPFPRSGGVNIWKVVGWPVPKGLMELPSSATRRPTNIPYPPSYADDPLATGETPRGCGWGSYRRRRRRIGDYCLAAGPLTLVFLGSLNLWTSGGSNLL